MGTRIETYISMNEMSGKIGDKVLKPGGIGYPSLAGIRQGIAPEDKEDFDYVLGLNVQVKCVNPERTVLIAGGDYFFMYGDGEKQIISDDFEDLGIRLSACITNFHERPSIPGNL